MLHSSLPRAFLAPGLNYLGYYGSEIHQHPYGTPTTWHIPLENPTSYSRISDHHVLQSWDLSRSSTPCPLDLSLKPPPASSAPQIEHPLGLDIEKDDGAINDGQNEAGSTKYRKDSDESSTMMVDDFDGNPRSSSAHSHSSYEQLLSRKELKQAQEPPGKDCPLDDATLLASFGSPSEIASKYYTHNPKLLLSSPSHLQSVQSYHQQLLLTPQHHLQGMQHAPMTPPSTPSPPQCPRRKLREEDCSPPSTTSNAGTSTGSRTSTAEKLLQRPKKKHARRLKFDEDTSSPVSGTVILGPDEAVVTGDIDPAFNIVEVTEEARAELAKIENRLGPYQCKLCRQLHEDAFQLAQHRCSRIAHVEYRCPECDKRFSCPANLASHRRWHKPRLNSGESSTTAAGIEIPCTRCDAKFTRQAALRKHLATQHPEANNNSNVALDAQAAAVGKTDIVQAVPEGSLTTEIP